MKIKRAASIPLITHDPYFSIWSSADHLYDEDTVHWSGIRQQMRGYVTVDENVFCFMGDNEFHRIIPQQYVDVSATKTEYYFENEKIGLTVTFTSPLLMDDPALLSRPCTYLDYKVKKKQECNVSLDIYLSSDLVSTKQDKIVGYSQYRAATPNTPAYSYASMGKAFQTPLGNSGDNITIDWGYAYLASDNEGAELYFNGEKSRIGCRYEFPEKEETFGMIVAYDDLLSINYFGQWRKGYWTQKYETIFDALGASFADKKSVLERAKRLDEEIYKKAEEIGGEEYAFLCNFSYRHSIAAHKLITNEAGEIIFLSKENDSNGCIGTVDLSYPSSPLYLLYNTELLKGMLRPVFEFAGKEVWEYDFAPHDVGRYPYAWGQVYGMDEKTEPHRFCNENGAIFPPFYQYPKGSNVYCHASQMPVEECGNMLIMAGAICQVDGNAEFAKPYMEILRKWTGYLLDYGMDPGEQLCTDDFAGHLSHNVNLSAKAILGIEAFAGLTKQCGNSEEADKYHKKAKEMAAEWEKRALADDHYMLTYNNPESWSLKYNIIWDKFFESGLFSNEVFEREYAYYLKKTNTYGTPLDNRRTYTKSDWVLWCAAMAEDKSEMKKMIKPVADYLENTTSRFPFSDWYETETGEFCHFKARSVQGGIFMPMLIKS